MKKNGIHSQNKSGYSKDYETFLHDYFTGNPMIRGRREEDTSVWEKLKGDELESAKLKIIENLNTFDESYIIAAGIFKDDRAIKPLEKIAKEGPNIHIRLCAAKTLYDWGGFENYIEMLDNAFDKAGQFTKTDLSFWINGLDEETALKFFWRAMNDQDSFVRYCSYEALECYYGIWKYRKDGFHIKYYTDEEVYQDKELFEERKAELKEKIKNWKKTKSNDMDSLGFKDPDSILKMVVKLYEEIWTDSKKWNKNHHKIKQYLTELLTEYPNDTRALTNLGAILSDNGKHKDALTELLKAEKLESKDANLYRNIGIVKMNIESERQNAKEYFEIANKLESDELTIEAYFDPQGY